LVLIWKREILITTLLKWYKKSEHLPNSRNGHAAYSFLANISMPHRRKKCSWYIIQYIFGESPPPTQTSTYFRLRSNLTYLSSIRGFDIFLKYPYIASWYSIYSITISCSYNRSYVVASSSTVVRWQPRG